MVYKNQQVAKVAKVLKERLRKASDKGAILKAPELKALFAYIATLPNDQRSSFGAEINKLKAELAAMTANNLSEENSLAPIDVSAPFDINTPPDKRPHLLTADQGSQHPVMTELNLFIDIFERMGFTAVESPQLDDDYHMFTSLNFPQGHPARDDYDTFMTSEGLIAPAHTSTMQNRVLKRFKSDLANDQPIAVVIPGRVFRNEDLDARHEHTFYQLEGVYVGKGVHAGMLIATLKTFFQEYYQKELKIKTQPFYFPFTEPSFEFAASCVFCDQKGCSVCSYSGWIELLGCGMINPAVLSEAGIDPKVYTGFAWGGGVERPVMLKYNIDDIRYFESGRLDFLRQFT